MMVRRSTVFGGAKGRALSNELETISAEAFIPVQNHKDLDTFSVAHLID
jgi:hypothetical protein